MLLSLPCRQDSPDAAVMKCLQHSTENNLLFPRHRFPLAAVPPRIWAFTIEYSLSQSKQKTLLLCLHFLPAQRGSVSLNTMVSLIFGAFHFPKLIILLRILVILHSLSNKLLLFHILFIENPFIFFCIERKTFQINSLSTWALTVPSLETFIKYRYKEVPYCLAFPCIHT